MPILRGARFSLVCLFLFLLGTPILAQTVSLLDTH